MRAKVQVVYCQLILLNTVLQVSFDLFCISAFTELVGRHDCECNICPVLCVGVDTAGALCLCGCLALRMQAGQGSGKKILDKPVKIKY